MAKNTVDVEVIKEQLSSGKKTDLRKAVKLIAKNDLTEFSDNLFAVLSDHISDGKMWEMNYDVIRFLGKIKYAKAIPILVAVCDKNEAHDMVTSGASTALCRIRRTSLNDTKEVQRLLSVGNFAVIDGALRSMGIDQVIPTENEIIAIIASVNRFEPKREKGYADIREGLAVACAGWGKNETVKIFLEGCLNSGDSPLVKLAKSSVNGKYANIDY